MKAPRVSMLASLYLADGVTLARDAASANGVSETLLRLRLKKGEAPDRAVRPVSKGPNAFQKGEHTRPYDPTMKARMGEALRALYRALNSRASWERVYSDAEAQRAACAIAQDRLNCQRASEAAELTEASELVRCLGPKDKAATKAERSAINMAAHRQMKARESLSRTETQAKGAADRLARSEHKAASARRSLDALALNLPGLCEAALPFAPWVLRSPDRSPKLAAYLSAHVNHEPQ